MRGVIYVLETSYGSRPGDPAGKNALTFFPRIPRWSQTSKPFNFLMIQVIKQMKNKKASGNDIIPANFHAREKVIHVMSPYSLEIQE